MSAAKFKMGDRVICKNEYDLARYGATGEVIKVECGYGDPFIYVSWDTPIDEGYIHEDEEGENRSNVWGVGEDDLELELPEIKDRPEADVIEFPRETDTTLIPVEEHEAYEAADEDDCLINVSAMQRDLPRGVVATITITG